MIELLKYISKLTKDSDIAVAFLGIGVGFFADSLLNIRFPWLRISPDSASIYFAATVFGAKRAIQAIRKPTDPNELDKTRRAKLDSNGSGAILERAENLSRLIREADRAYPGFPPSWQLIKAREGLELELELFKEGVITSEELQASVIDALRSFKAYRLGQ